MWCDVCDVVWRGVWCVWCGVVCDVVCVMLCGVMCDVVRCGMLCVMLCGVVCDVCGVCGVVLSCRVWLKNYKQRERLRDYNSLGVFGRFVVNLNDAP